jgi:triosephosphate isomerase (TIM)
MTFARPIILGNWKMNGLRRDGVALATEIADRARSLDATVGVFPSATLLREVAEAVADRGLLVGAQDCHQEPSGAFTGSISARMVADAGGRAAILGHSERRHGLGETDALVRAKTQAAIDAGLVAVVCIGETEQEWQAGQRETVLRRQIEESLPESLPAERVTLAYEPVWAIGTGRTPSIEDVRATHAFIRARLRDRWTNGGEIPILYGGSVKADNAGALLAVESVDGALVGGASLQAQGFISIVEAGIAARA